ncbi:MAG: hypothetical protein KDA73_16495 [Rhodobacteraceae bacterium]|nr:hypothetical protein [Paracoccaceae bacterium]
MSILVPEDVPRRPHARSARIGLVLGDGRTVCMAGLTDLPLRCLATLTECAATDLDVAQ